MLIVANGAFKSGSTWLYVLAREILPQCKPPSRYLNPRWPEPTIIPGRLADYLRHGEHRSQDVLIKSHYGLLPLRWLLLKDPQVRVLNIRRDLRDVVVSAYYHYQVLDRVNESFANFYWRRGRQVARFVLHYHIIWETDSPVYICLQYENLLRNLAPEVIRLGGWLGVQLGGEQVERIQTATQIDTLRAHSGLSPDRFRRGMAGEWESHFDATMLQDLGKIENQSQSRLYRQWVKACSILRYSRIRIRTVLPH